MPLCGSTSFAKRRISCTLPVFRSADGNKKPLGKCAGLETCLGSVYQRLSHDGLIAKPSCSSLSFKRKKKVELLLWCSRNRREGGHGSARRLQWQLQLTAFLHFLTIPACSGAALWRNVLVKQVRKVAGIGEGMKGLFLIQADPRGAWWCYPGDPCNAESTGLWPNSGDRDSQSWRCHHSCPLFELGPGGVSPPPWAQQLLRRAKSSPVLKSSGTSRGDSCRGNFPYPNKIVSSFSF